MAADGPPVAHPLARAAVRALGIPEPLARDAQLRRDGVADHVSNTSPLGDSLAGYPVARPAELQGRYAAFLAAEQVRHKLDPPRLSADHVLFTEGSAAAIDLLVRTFCEPGVDRVCVCGPTFPFYARAARAADVEVVDVPLGGDAYERVDVAGLSAARPKLTFLCSPNNPVGSSLDDSDVVDALRALPGLVVIDEAYVEFADRASAVRLSASFPRLVVLRTFSKAWGAAGARAGAVVGDPRILETMRLVQTTYAFGTSAQELVAARLGNPAPMRRHVKLVECERARLASRLEEIASVVRVFPSDANFVLAQVTGAAEVQRSLAAAGMLVGRAPLPEGESLRISIGTADANDHLIDALSTLANSR